MGDPNVDLIMVATGTGIAPYRSFIRRLFVEKTPFGEAYKGLAWLFLDVANTDALLYDDEWQEVLKSHPDNFKLDYAHGQWRAHVFLRPEGHDARHHPDAREGVGGQGPCVGGEA